jgi:N-acetylglucosaminyldiphosphoundecaprenol N-acetyl-beta-D-mannosaminyltransferase
MRRGERVRRPERCTILGIGVDATSYEDATVCVMDWASRGESRYVCLGVVASVMEARDSAKYREALEAADLVTPDGMPLVWMLRGLGARPASRVYGPDLTLAVLAAAQNAGAAVGFYGSSKDVLTQLVEKMRQRFPKLDVAFAQAPPFRPMSEEEDDEVVRAIGRSGARILFVGLGGAKQDLWMAGHRGRVPAVMLGVGAAFDFLAGTKPQAPRWMQRNGLEWFFRLATEPRRLWRRYLGQNPRFAVLALAQILRERSS